MIDITTLSLKLDYLFGGMGYYSCVRAEVTGGPTGVAAGSTDNIVFYKIERDAMFQYLLEHLEYADVAEIVEELIQPGVIFFFNEGEHGHPRTVKIEQVENVWGKLKRTIVLPTAASPVPESTADTAIEAADTIASTEEAESAMAEETASEAVNEAVNNTVGNDEQIDEPAEIGTEPASDNTFTADVGRENTPMDSVGPWDTAIAILGSDVVGEGVETDFIIQLLRDKVIQAGKYDITILSRNPKYIWEVKDADEPAEPTNLATNSSEDTAAETTEVAADNVGNDEADETAVVADAASILTDQTDTEAAPVASEEAADSVNTQVLTEDESENVEDAEETDDGEPEEGEDSDREIATINAILFVIKNILHHRLFDFPEPPMLLRDQTNARIAAMQALTGKHVFLRNRNKDVEAEGVMLDDGKRIIVIAGSTVNEENRLPNQKGQTSSATLREKLIDDGVILDCKFTKDYEFNSTSAAASVILGQSANGLTSWKDENGIKLETLLGRG